MDRERFVLTGQVGEGGGQQAAGEEERDGQKPPRTGRRGASFATAVGCRSIANVAAQPRRSQRRQGLPAVARIMSCSGAGGEIVSRPLFHNHRRCLLIYPVWRLLRRRRGLSFAAVFYYSWGHQLTVSSRLVVINIESSHYRLTLPIEISSILLVRLGKNRLEAEGRGNQTLSN